MKRVSYLTLTDIFKKKLGELLFIMFYHKPAFYTRSYRLGAFGCISFTTSTTVSDPFISWSRAPCPSFQGRPRASAQYERKPLGSLMPGSILGLQGVFVQSQIHDVEECFLVGMLLSIVFKNYLLLNSLSGKWLSFSLKLTENTKSQPSYHHTNSTHSK